MKEIAKAQLQAMPNLLREMAATKQAMALTPSAAFPDLYADPATLTAAHGVADLAMATAYLQIADELENIVENLD